MIVPLEHILILAGLLFFIGMGGLLAWRANLIMMLVCIEVMLNAVMLVFVAGSARWGNADGQLFAIFIMALTSSEVSLALAMVVYLHRRRKTVNTDMFSEMKGLDETLPRPHTPAAAQWRPDQRPGREQAPAPRG